MNEQSPPILLQAMTERGGTFKVTGGGRRGHARALIESPRVRLSDGTLPVCFFKHLLDVQKLSFSIQSELQWCYHSKQIFSEPV